MPPLTVEQIISAALRQGRGYLLEPEAKQICKAYGLPTPDFAVATSPSDAAKVAEKVGFPVVLKIVSGDILHKTEAGGVLVDLRTTNDVESGYAKLIGRVRAYKPNARVEGILVQHMAPKGVEVIVGGIRDIQFGPTVLFGLGGIFVEVLKDVSFRVAPLSELDSREMIREIRSYAALKGFRGQPASDELAIMRIIQGVSQLMLENPAIEQLDLNPVMVYSNGATIVDARMILKTEPSRGSS